MPWLDTGNGPGNWTDSSLTGHLPEILAQLCTAVNEREMFTGRATVRVFSITRSGSVATATMSTSGIHGQPRVVGDIIRIEGADQSEYNGFHVVTSVGSNTIQFSVSGTPASPATGNYMIGYLFKKFPIFGGTTKSFPDASDFVDLTVDLGLPQVLASIQQTIDVIGGGITLGYLFFNSSYTQSYATVQAILALGSYGSSWLQLTNKPKTASIILQIREVLDRMRWLHMYPYPLSGLGSEIGGSVKESRSAGFDWPPSSPPQTLTPPTIAAGLRRTTAFNVVNRAYYDGSVEYRFVPRLASVLDGTFYYADYYLANPPSTTNQVSFTDSLGFLHELINPFSGTYRIVAAPRSQSQVIGTTPVVVGFAWTLPSSYPFSTAIPILDTARLLYIPELQSGTGAPSKSFIRMTLNDSDLTYG